MKALIVSDSHGEIDNLERAVMQTQPDCVYHLGDHKRDCTELFQRFPYISMYAVCGNCDRGESGDLILRDEIGGIRLMGCHGHKYGVKSDLMRLRYAAMEMGVKLCMYGHTHIPFCEEIGEILFLNPGACSGYDPTYATVEVVNGELQCKLHRLNK